MAEPEAQGNATSNSAENLFEAFKDDFPPALLEQLANPPKLTGEQAKANVVYVLIHTSQPMYYGLTFDIVGIFDSLSLANQRALEALMEYNEWWEEQDDWSHFCPPGKYGVVGWEISESGGLSFEVQNSEGDVVQLYVERHVLHSEMSEKPRPKPFKKRKLEASGLSDEEDEDEDSE